MDLKEAVKARHSVRKYLDTPLDERTVRLLREETGRCNAEGGLNIQLVTEEPRAFSSGIFKYGAFSGVRNYFVMAAEKGESADERLGYYGERLVLLSQTLGLNTCWVGLTYKKVPGTYTLGPGESVRCVIALGYGADQGHQHPQREIGRFIEADGPLPDWFVSGVEAAVLAPTAVNQQKFKFILHEGAVVEARTSFSLAGYTHIDLGIVKCHFEIGAGKENFTWMP